MKKKIMLSLVMLMILTACGEKASVKDLWSDYQGEVFVSIDVSDWSDLYEKDLKGLQRYEFIYLDEENNLHEIKSFAKHENGAYVSTEDGLDLAKETVVPLEDHFTAVSKTQFFLKNTNDDAYSGYDKVYWFDQEKTCLHAVFLYQALGETLSMDKNALKDVTEKLQTREKDILDMEDSCDYEHLQGASYKLLKSDFVDDLKLAQKLGFNTPFEFKEMKINFTGIDSWTKVDNQFSDYHGQDVFLLAVELENLSNEKNKLNMFSYKAFNSEGKESPNVSTYFDNTIDFHEELLTGAKTKALYPILYSGDGEYQIHFGKDKVITFDIQK